MHFHALLLVSFLTLSAIAGAQSLSPEPGFLAKPLLLGAHRGGSNNWPENTVVAFEAAAKRWPDILLEGDLRLTKDGHLVLMHDGTVDRTTNGTGKVSEKTLEELKALDAAYKFSPDDGHSFPWRGKGVTIPTFEDALRAAPGHRFLIELKGDPAGVPAMLKTIEKEHAEGRVLLASFNPEIMADIRKRNPGLLTCFDMNNGMELLKALRNGAWDSYAAPAPVLSVTTELQEQFKITPEEIGKIRAKGIVYQLHTLNTREEMRAAVDAGVDAILTDDPILLDEVLRARP